MADIYLSSVDGSDSDDGSTWALAKATLAAAMTAAGAGGRVFVDSAHAESLSSAMSLASPGTAAAPVQVLCVDRTGNPEPPTALATSASVSTTGNSSITFTGHAYCYGVTFNAGDSTSGSSGIAFGSNAVNTDWILESCLLHTRINNVNAGFQFGLNSTNARAVQLTLRNTDMQFAHSNKTINVNQGRLRWFGGAIQGATLPTNLFTFPLGNSGRVLCGGVDLSPLNSSSYNLVKADGDQSGKAIFTNCKLGSGVVIVNAAGIASAGAVQVDLVNCDSADTNYRTYHAAYQGEIFSETTIVRTGGASDGTTTFSRKMVTSANTKFYTPLVLDSIAVWNEDTGSAKTVSIEVLTDGVTLTDEEAWIEVEYLGTSGFPKSTLIDDAKADALATAANQASSSETWTTTGLSSPVTQTLSVSLTPQEKGPIRVRVMLAKPSTTMYVCPKVSVA